MILMYPLFTILYPFFFLYSLLKLTVPCKPACKPSPSEMFVNNRVIYCITDCHRIVSVCVIVYMLSVMSHCVRSITVIDTEYT